METLQRVVLAILVLVAIGLAVFGSYFLTAETVGVGMIGGAILIAILARMSQAADHHADLRKLLERAKAP